MKERAFPHDPELPGLAPAIDLQAMQAIFEDALRPRTNRPCRVRTCRITRVRYRRGQRCVLQYSLDLVDLQTGATSTQWVTGVIYAEGLGKHARLR